MNNWQLTIDNCKRVKIQGYTTIIARFLFLVSLFPIFVPCVRSLMSGFCLPLYADGGILAFAYPRLKSGATISIAALRLKTGIGVLPSYLPITSFSHPPSSLRSKHHLRLPSDPGLSALMCIYTRTVISRHSFPRGAAPLCPGLN